MNEIRIKIEQDRDIARREYSFYVRLSVPYDVMGKIPDFVRENALERLTLSGGFASVAARLHAFADLIQRAEGVSYEHLPNDGHEHPLGAKPRAINLD